MNWDRVITLFDPDYWEGTATLIASLTAVGGVLIGFWVDRTVRRNARRAEAYAGALQAVHDYLEAPYRIRRSSGSAQERFALVAAVSDVQSRLAYFDGLLTTVAPAKVHAEFQVLVAAAREEAGVAMTDAWKSRPTRRNADVPLRGPLFEHPISDAAREKFLLLTR